MVNAALRWPSQRNRHVQCPDSQIAFHTSLLYGSQLPATEQVDSMPEKRKRKHNKIGNCSNSQAKAARR
jgi:hypothetical protein